MKSDVLSRTLTHAIGALQQATEDNVRDFSLFDCIFILDTLPQLTQLSLLRKQCATRLIDQVHMSWIEQGEPYTVFATLTALWRYDPACVRGDHLAKALQRLILCETQPGGPYCEGTIPSVSLNAQIAVFAKLVAQPLPNLRIFLDSVVGLEHFGNTELTHFGLFYLLAQANSGQQLTQYVTDHWHNKQWQTSASQAIALSILGDSISIFDAERTIAIICQQQKQDGFWAGEPMQKAPICGSTFATTAIIVQTLHTYQNDHTKKSQTNTHTQHQLVKHAARQMFKARGSPLRNSALLIVDQVCANDKNFEITLLPYIFAKALREPLQLAGQQYTALGLANLYGWIAYTIYDDFLDNEGILTHLPVANVAMRASLDCFRAAAPNHRNFQTYVGEVFTTMDEANAWELDNCRFNIRSGKITITSLPRYGVGAVLADRSFAHALAAIAILTNLATVLASPAQTHFVKVAFRHYLIARQLNDDMHDWTSDLIAGRASYVVTAILRDMRIVPGKHKLDTLMPKMQRCFRQKTMKKVCRTTLQNIEYARHAFTKSQLLQETNDTYALLDHLEQAVWSSLDHYKKGQALIAAQKSDINQNSR